MVDEKISVDMDSLYAQAKRYLSILVIGDALHTTQDIHKLVQRITQMDICAPMLNVFTFLNTELDEMKDAEPQAYVQEIEGVEFDFDAADRSEYMKKQCTCKLCCTIFKAHAAYTNHIVGKALRHVTVEQAEDMEPEELRAAIPKDIDADFNYKQAVQCIDAEDLQILRMSGI